MTITISLIWVAYVLAGYFGIGVLLFPLILILANRRVLPKQAWHDGWDRPKFWVGSAVAWPLILWDLWITPRRNRKVMERYREATKYHDY